MKNPDSRAVMRPAAADWFPAQFELRILLLNITLKITGEFPNHRNVFGAYRHHTQ
jgi:hypothetical protein